MSSVEVEELERLLASATLPGVQAALRALLEKEREKVRPIDCLLYTSDAADE